MRVPSMNKRGDVLLIIVVIIIVIMFILMLFDNFAYRECRSDNDCNDESYCGVDHTCHKFPVIKETTVKESVKQDLVGPAAILGFAIVIAAVVLKWKMPRTQQ